MIVPLGIIAVLNATRGRSWAFWALPHVMVAYLALEFVGRYCNGERVSSLPAADLVRAAPRAAVNTANRRSRP